MFVTADQLFVFLVCIYLGLIFGIIYDVFYCFKNLLGIKYVSAILDVLFFVLFGGGYVFVSFLFNFPDFRLYMFIGCQLGLLIYIKSFHFFLAKGVEMIYNRKAKKRK